MRLWCSFFYQPGWSWRAGPWEDRSERVRDGARPQGKPDGCSFADTWRGAVASCQAYGRTASVRPIRGLELESNMFVRTRDAVFSLEAAEAPLMKKNKLED